MRAALLRRPDPDYIEVALGEEAVRIILRRRPSARRLTLRVSSATGEVVITLPARSTVAAARDFASSHSGWIAARLAKVPERVPLAPGVTIPFRGVEHRVVHRLGRGVTTASIVDGAPAIVLACDPAHVARRLRDYLQREVRKDLSAAARIYAGRVGALPKRITVRDTRSRWGSCTARGELNFSWRLILAPPMVLDYLVAHEMAHLRELNHSPRFWALLRSVCPHVDEAERWLKRHGSGLHRYG